MLLPALLPDNDLDWGEYTGEGSLARVRHGGRMELFEPAGERLGPEAVTRADVVLLPGSRWTAAGCAWGAGAARTTGCWPGWKWRARAPRCWCCSTTGRSSSTSPRSRTTGRWTRW